ncbi:MAG: hypothetical protein RR831_17180 [Stenotrophomonas sp.]
MHRDIGQPCLRQIRIRSGGGIVASDPVRIATPAPAMNMSPLPAGFAALALVAAALIAPATQAADTPSASAGDSCIALSEDQQIVRAGADRDVLLRNGDQHYRVVFTSSCSSAVTSRRLAFETQGESNQLCGGSRSELKTDRASCTVERIEPLEATTFKRMARQRSR